MRPPLPLRLFLAALLAAAPTSARPPASSADRPAAGSPEDIRDEEALCPPPSDTEATEPGDEGKPKDVPAPDPRCSGPDPSLDGTAGRPAAAHADAQRSEAQRARSSAAGATAERGARALLGSLTAGEGGPPGAPGAAPSPGASAGLRALNAAPAAQSAYAHSLQTGDVPQPGEHGHDLHAMGDAALAPAPTLFARAASLTYRSGPLVAEDMAAVRGGLADFTLPPGAAGLASSDAPLASFVDWAKTAKGDQLPSISYGILSEGELGRYSPGLLGPGSITMNHHIREMPADERAAVLLHELYHHWDKKVAKLHYANVSYGFIDPSHMPEHEYDAYYLTALYRQATRKEGSSSRLAKFLDALPSDPDEVRAAVDKTVGGRR